MSEGEKLTTMILPTATTTDQVVLEHLKLMKQILDQVQEGVLCANTTFSSVDGVIIHKGHLLSVITLLGRSIWACQDLIKHRKEEDEGEEKEKEEGGEHPTMEDKEEEEQEERQPARIWEANVSLSLFLGVCLDPGEDAPTVEEVLAEILENHPFVDGFKIITSGKPFVRVFYPHSKKNEEQE